MNASDDGNHPSENNEQRRKGKGRQKIAMEKIENETNLQVTFSKRRAGVFKKASELSTLCGAESAVVVFSPGNKPHSFGHPNVETVANRFLHASGEAAPPPTNADQLIMVHSEAAMQQRNHELVRIEAQLELERQRKKDLEGGENQRPPPLEEMDYEQLDRMKKAVLSFKHELEAKEKNASAAMEAMGNNPAWDALPYEAFGIPNMAMGNPNLANIQANPGGAPFPPPFDPRLGNYGYTVHCPPFGVGGSSSDHVYNYGDPSGMVSTKLGAPRSVQARRPPKGKMKETNFKILALKFILIVCPCACFWV